MDFELTDSQKDLKKAAREFAEGEFEDELARECDRKEKFPEDLWKKGCELGFVGAWLPEKYGGGGLGAMGQAILNEEFWRVDPGLGNILIAIFGSEIVMFFGNEEQKEKYLTPLTKGEAIMGGAITEPDAGTDVASVSTKAEKDGDEWVINGNKQFITNGTTADYLATLCVTDPDADKRHKRHSVIMVETDRDGVKADKLDGKLGIRASPTAEIVYDDVRVPEENLIGERGNGFYQFMQFFNFTRLGIAAQGVGVAQGALEEALDYTDEREAFGQNINQFQGIKWELADMATRVEAARNLVRKAAWLWDQDNPDPGVTAMAKKYAGETAVYVTNEALQMHGGYGYIDDYKVQRFYRDAKITEIYEGTREAEKLTIADQYLNI